MSLRVLEIELQLSITSDDLTSTFIANLTLFSGNLRLTIYTQLCFTKDFLVGEGREPRALSMRTAAKRRP